MTSPLRSTRPLALALTGLLIAAASSSAAEPKLSVSKAKLARALKCGPGIAHAKRTPIMLVTGTGISGDEAYSIGKPAFDHYGAPVCYVNFPNYTTADLQISVQYLVSGLRVMSRRAGRDVAIVGISQGGLLARAALTYWPSLRNEVSDVISVAGTQHGTTNRDFTGCARKHRRCVPALFQQARGSNFLTALNAHGDETPGPTAWTTVRSTSDETVTPQTGNHPASALTGASNIVIQKVCPGRTRSHLGTALDSVTFAAIIDAVDHRGPALASRLPGDVCSHPYASGLNESSTTTLLAAGASLAQSRFKSEPHVAREPALKAWASHRVR